MRDCGNHLYLKPEKVVSSGFSILELMVVISIVSLLAAISIAPVQRYRIKAAQTEAKINLKAERTNFEAYYANNGTYGAPTVISNNGTHRYQYSRGSSATEYVIIAAEKGNCAARAISRFCSLGDLWMATNNGVFLVFDSAACSGSRDFTQADTAVKRGIKDGIMLGLTTVAGMTQHGTGCP